MDKNFEALMSERTFSFSIDTEITAFHMKNLVDFIYRQHISMYPDRFTKVSNTMVNGTPVLAFTMLGKDGNDNVEVEVTGALPIQVKVASDENVAQKTIDRVKEDLIILVGFFEEQVRRNTLYFAWREGEKI